MRKNILICSIICCAVILQSEPVQAQALFDSGTNFLTALQNLLTNTWARIFAIISVVCLGVLWMMGRLAWSAAISVIGGIILVFGAPAIVDSIAGSL
jgi:type IV secretion system protein VirB2